MSKKVVPPAEEFSLFDLANAYLLVQKHNTITVAGLVDLLLAEAIATAAVDGNEEDAGKYALLAAQLATAFEFDYGQPTEGVRP